MNGKAEDRSQKEIDICPLSFYNEGIKIVIITDFDRRRCPICNT